MVCPQLHLSQFQYHTPIISVYDFHFLNLTICAGKFKPVIKKAMVELEGNTAMPSILYCHHST